MAPSAGLAAAVSAAAFAALARVLGLWTGDFSRGAALAALCAAAGLAAARLGGAPGERARGAWSVAAGVAGAAFAAWARLSGLNAHDPALLDPAASVSALALLPAAALLFFLLGRAARGAHRAQPLHLLAAPAALAATHLALERADPALVLAAACAPWLLAAPPRAALAGLAVAGALGWHARAALRDVWTLRLDGLYPGARWLWEPAGGEGLGALRFPDGRLALLRAGRVYFEDPLGARAVVLAALGQRPEGSVATSALCVTPRSPSPLNAARNAGLDAVVVDPDPRAGRVVEALWKEMAAGAEPSPGWAPRRRPEPGPAAGLLLLRVPGRGAERDRRGTADRRALAAWRRALDADAPGAVLLAGQAAEADVAAARADAAAVFGHAAVLDLPAHVVVVASPRPVLTDPQELARRLPLPARMGWDAAAFLGRLRWRPDGARK